LLITSAIVCCMLHGLLVLLQLLCWLVWLGFDGVYLFIFCQYEWRKYSMTSIIYVGIYGVYMGPSSEKVCHENVNLKFLA